MGICIWWEGETEEQEERREGVSQVPTALWEGRNRKTLLWTDTGETGWHRG